MADKSTVLADVGARLRRERERLGCKQDQLGDVAGITRQSQAEYEAGKRPFTISYLLAVGDAGVDVSYVVNGERSGAGLEEDEGELLVAFGRLAPAHRDAVTAIVDGLVGAPTRTLQAPAPAYAPPPADLPPDLPSQAALARALEGVLAVYPDLHGGELARALARHLPSVLGAAADALPDQAASAPARADNPLPNRREPQPARRT